MSIHIPAVILASGMSKRMGTPKQLLLLDGVCLLEFVIQKILPFPFEKIQVIIGNQADEIMNQIKIKDSRFEWKVNDRFQDGQSSALKLGSKASANTDGMMVFLADQPLIRKETINVILDTSKRLLVADENEFVVQPSYREERDILFSSLDMYFLTLKCWKET